MVLQILAQLCTERESSVSDLCNAYGGEDGRQNKNTENVSSPPFIKFLT